MAALGAFASRQRAAEGHWFATEGSQAVMRHLEKMVQEVRRQRARRGRRRRYYPCRRLPPIPLLPASCGPCLSLATCTACRGSPQASPVPGPASTPSRAAAAAPLFLPLSPQGKVERAVLEAAQRAQEGSAASGPPTEVVNRRKEYVYQHRPGLVPGKPHTRPPLPGLAHLLAWQMSAAGLPPGLITSAHPW